MIALYERWIDAYPIVSIEDGLDENDWAGFSKQTGKQGGRIQIVGDDIFVTNPKFIARAIKERTANAVLIKLNQIGTVGPRAAANASRSTIGYSKSRWNSAKRAYSARHLLRPRRSCFCVGSQPEGAAHTAFHEQSKVGSDGSLQVDARIRRK
jgi:hypothetical protein